MSQSSHLRTRAAAAAPERLLYDQVAGAAAGLVLRSYSSSFGLASRILHQPVRDHIRNVYALVRLADEVVDGPMALARPRRAAQLLDRLERDTLETLTDDYSTNLVVHAFTATARQCGIDAALITPFFASMRTDLTVRRHDQSSFETYVYGSAEVVGLMCLRVFLACEQQGRPLPTRQQRYDELAAGARRLGSAFQKINFLRDLADDFHGRDRAYFPGIDPEHLREHEKIALLDDIDADLAAAELAIQGLPDNCRAAVTVAHAVFDELANRLRQTPAAVVTQRRVRLSAPTKARVAVAAVLGGRRR